MGKLVKICILFAILENLKLKKCLSFLLLVGCRVNKYLKISNSCIGSADCNSYENLAAMHFRCPVLYRKNSNTRAVFPVMEKFVWRVSVTKNDLLLDCMEILFCFVLYIGVLDQYCIFFSSRLVSRLMSFSLASARLSCICLPRQRETCTFTRLPLR